MSDRSKLLFAGPIAGFFVVVAFGVGVIASAAFESRPLGGTLTTAAGGSENVLDVDLGDLFIEPASLDAAPGPLTINVTNSGKIEHNFAITGVGATEMLAPGESTVLEVDDIAAGSYEVICAVPGHADGGMKGTLTVGASSGDEQADASGGMSGMSAQEMLDHDAHRTGMFPAETEGKGLQELKPKIVDGVKVFELTADEIEWETEPGVTQEAWAYNGMVPGPEIKANLGDKVKIVLRNELAEPTSLHLHGLIVPTEMDGVPVISQPAIMPGEKFAYEFTVRNSGSNMYHSHFNANKQVPMGLLGSFIVKDPSDPPVDVDYTMVLNDGPLGFTLNGKGFPATEPLVLKKGQTIRIRYMNEGFLLHPMHLHGMPQQVIAKDGHLLPQPYMADTVTVAPGERFDVLVKATETGVWAFHCHVLNHAEGPDGMFGMVTAMIVD